MEEFGVEHYRAAWGLLAAIERDDGDGDLDLANEISNTWDPMQLQKGLAIVAQVLLTNLRGHAEDHGCDCGTFEWVERMALRAGDDDPDDDPDHE